MTISIVYGKTENVLNNLSGMDIRLNQGEMENYNRLRFPNDQRDYLAAHLLARYCIHHLTGVAIHEIELTQHCATCGGNHGKPEVMHPATTFVSWSHTSGYVASISAHKPVGIDIEKMGAVLDSAFGDSFLSPLEREGISLADGDEISSTLYKLWVKKESLIKLGLYRIEEMRDICLASSNTFYSHNRKKYAFIDIHSNPLMGAAVYEIEDGAIEKVSLTHL
ncbi:4'-phosphopantetheinyl transferase family protein [Shouchella hunanensis]|uniref:4'-phosphopantetheinyl transferase superfamily protein n=1 Tax=Shouchella hunanensis TaxID=766894 RepID=A0ABY7VZ90_9BACI|nr:4'-phosphopantetheinyl transferase superfamily protein [Shouchella hunanensis]WDF02045.1 4'-phosphopantetheinyl transferase superfamily protein [Shouchella hunanensis]